MQHPPPDALPPAEGRLEPGSGNLQCSYHGWQFGPDGRCAAVPQADSQQAAAAALHSPRSCVAAYPVRQVCGLLWVWMDPASPDAAHGRPLPLPPELLDGGAALLGDWWARAFSPSCRMLHAGTAQPLSPPVCLLASVELAGSVMPSIIARLPGSPVPLQVPARPAGVCAVPAGEPGGPGSRAPRPPRRDRAAGQARLAAGCSFVSLL